MSELPLILSFVFAAIAAGAIAWALWVRQTMAREAELVQLVRDRTAQLEDANRRLEALSYQDALTGVANRRALDEALDIEWRRGIRSKRPLSFVLLDVDHFKGFNDTYGHPAGDRTLARVAAALASVVRRAGDRIARYGGEEFAALLPETDRPGAEAIAERMRAAVEALAIPNTAAGSGRLTISVGHTTVLATDNGTQESVVAAADRALYEAKRKGRNLARAGDITVPSDSIAAAGLHAP